MIVSYCFKQKGTKRRRKIEDFKEQYAPFGLLKSLQDKGN